MTNVHTHVVVRNMYHPFTKRFDRTRYAEAPNSKTRNAIVFLTWCQAIQLWPLCTQCTQARMRAQSTPTRISTSEKYSASVICGIRKAESTKTVKCCAQVSSVSSKRSRSCAFGWYRDIPHLLDLNESKNVQTTERCSIRCRQRWNAASWIVAFRVDCCSAEPRSKRMHASTCKRMLW